jgi:stearoyl-CoA desaturase (Delta-9 desaturase)
MLDSEGEEANARLPSEVLRLSPKVLRRERRLIAVAVGVPIGSLIVAAFVIAKSGISAVDVVLLATMFCVSGLGIEVGFHRLFSHRSFRATDRVRIVLAIAGCMAGQGPVIYWVSHHRLHHANADRHGDPHSPYCPIGGLRVRVVGLVHAHIGWVFGSERASPGRFARDLLGDPNIRWVDHYYLVWLGLGLLIPAVAGWLIEFSMRAVMSGLLFGGLVRLCLTQHSTYIVNSFCHSFGTRPYDTKDRSFNNGLLSIATFGGSWHNNHHAFPASATTCVRWWQMDPAYWLIRALQTIGFVDEVNLRSGT